MLIVFSSSFSMINGQQDFTSSTEIGGVISSLYLIGISEEERKCLLHCVVIGGGPTGVEFSGELSDFIMKDVHESFPHVKDYIKVTLIEVLIHTYRC